MKVRNGSIELNVLDDGDQSAPPLLLLHGITSYGGTWQWLVPEFAERFRVLRLDFRGHGDSDRAPDEYTSSGYVSDALAVLDTLDQPAIVMGHSLGGVTTAALAQHHADRLRAAIMEDPPLGLGPQSTSDQPLEGNSLLDAFHLMRESIPQLQASGITREVLTGTIEAFLGPEGGFGVPSLIICADPSKPDAVADPDLAHGFASRSDAVDVRIIDGAGHLIHDELASRDTFRRAVLDFLATLA